MSKAILLYISIRMPANKKGGKGYKKGKGEKTESVFIDIQPGQFMARAIRILGDRNVLCFCHDNVMRICHICRRMKGFSEDKKIEPGDIVLVSLRDFASVDPKTIKRGDILAKYAPEQLQIVKSENVYPNLFLKIEDRGMGNMIHLGVDLADSVKLQNATADDAFSFEGSDDSEESSEEENKIVDKRDKVKFERAPRPEVDENADVNIDDI